MQGTQVRKKFPSGVVPHPMQSKDQLMQGSWVKKGQVSLRSMLEKKVSQFKVHRSRKEVPSLSLFNG
jgi:hypothetical protein